MRNLIEYIPFKKLKAIYIILSTKVFIVKGYKPDKTGKIVGNLYVIASTKTLEDLENLHILCQSENSQS